MATKTYNVTVTAREARPRSERLRKQSAGSSSAGSVSLPAASVYVDDVLLQGSMRSYDDLGLVNSGMIARIPLDGDDFQLLAKKDLNIIQTLDEHGDVILKNITEILRHLHVVDMGSAGYALRADISFYSDGNISAGGIGTGGGGEGTGITKINVGGVEVWNRESGTTIVNLPAYPSLTGYLKDTDILQGGKIKEGLLPAQGYVHTQSTASAIWTINHNLGKYPSVTIVDSAKNEVFGDVEYTSVNSVKLNFTAAFSGQAFLN